LADIYTLIASLLVEPLFWLIFGPLVSYVIIVILVRKTGGPKWARGWPLTYGAFIVKIRVWEKRASGYKPKDTRGRRWKSADGTEVYQTIKFGDIPSTHIKNLNMSDREDVLELKRKGTDDWEALHIEDDRSELVTEQVEQFSKYFLRDNLTRAMTKYKKGQDYKLLAIGLGVILVVGIALTMMMWVTSGNLSKATENIATALKSDETKWQMIFDYFQYNTSKQYNFGPGPQPSG
jgi:hypothetical protein